MECAMPRMSRLDVTMQERGRRMKRPSLEPGCIMGRMGGLEPHGKAMNRGQGKWLLSCASFMVGTAEMSLHLPKRWIEYVTCM
jgi:hypothetical protein